MKIALMAYFMIIATMFSNAQSLNPFVNMANVSPAPLLPREFNGTGVLSFNVGNSGSNPLPLVANQEMTLIISLSYGIPDQDWKMALGGTWVDKFIWSYDSAINTYQGIQNEDILASSSGTVTIQYKVATNSTRNNASNGFNINLQQPPYSTGINFTDDDAISSYTYVQAMDFGDAPGTYGSAMHEINIFKNIESGAYENYIYLGSSVDPEATDQASADANEDDIRLTDDEDGVTFPTLMLGDTVTIPVEISIHDFSTGALNVWFDWNGDGYFSDPEEKVVGPLSFYKPEIYSLSIIIPDTAITSMPTFARFRIGSDIGASGGTLKTYGEVEDYQISILQPQNLNIKTELISDINSIIPGNVTPGDVLTFNTSVINTGTSALTNIAVKNDKLSPGINSWATIGPGQAIEFVGTYTITQNDVDAGRIVLTSLTTSDETAPITIIELF